MLMSKLTFTPDLQLHISETDYGSFFGQGLRANLTRLYNTVSDESYTECNAQHKYQKLLFALIYFHSVLLERRKFRSVGLNIPYDFNDTDYKVHPCTCPCPLCSTLIIQFYGSTHC